MNELLKGKIEEVFKKVQADPGLLQKILADPAATLKQLLGTELPDEQIKSVTNALSSGDFNLDGVDLSDGFDMKDVQGIAGKLGGFLK